MIACGIVRSGPLFDDMAVRGLADAVPHLVPGPRFVAEYVSDRSGDRQETLRRLRHVAKRGVLVAVLAHRLEVGYVWLASRRLDEFDGKLYAMAQRRKKP